MAHPSTAREYFFSELGSHTNLAVKSAPVRQPKATEVLVKVHAVSLQFRDLAIAYKRYPVIPPKDLIPCSDMAGEVVAVGEDVKKWKKGDRVCANFMADFVNGECNPEIQQTSLGGESHGVLAEYKILPAHGLVHIPAHLSYEEASALPCAAVTAYNALHGPVPIKAGDNVLILGTGGVSIFALQFALVSGAVVIVTSSSDEKLKIASKLGAHHVINYKKNPDWEQEVLKLTGGVGVDHVVEVGGPGTLPKSITAARPGGSVHVIGFVAQDSTDISAILAIIAKSVTLRGLFVGSVANFNNMNRLINAHPEKTKPIIDKVFPFEQAQDAYAHLASQAHVGKVVIKVSKD